MGKQLEMLKFVSHKLDQLRFAALDQNPNGIRDILISCVMRAEREAPIIKEMAEALEVAQKTLAILINPEANEKATGASIINAFAQCTEAEAKASAALSAFRKGEGGE